MFSEDDLLPLSGLSHMAFCPRRWALIQLECVWAENRYTAEGSLLHEKAHSGDIESRPGVLVRRALPIRSFRLGLSGQADIVELHPMPDKNVTGLRLPARKGAWQVFPVEYKRSRDKAGSRAYRIQLCAQALCLEEMLNVSVPQGAVFDGLARRRQVVDFDAVLRSEVEHLAAAMHRLHSTSITPPPVLMPACRNCSLLDLCQPRALAGSHSAAAYMRRQTKDSL